MTHRPAGFLVRLLADLIDIFLLAIIFSLAIFVLSESQTLAQLIQGLLIYLITLGLPLGILGIFYRPAFTYYFGGSIGKLLTGLKVTDLNGHLLTFKKALFRFTIAQTFSTVLFGLGYFSIIKDPEKRAFHDKATPSKVIITQNIWPLGLVILIGLLTIHYLLWSNTLNKLSQSPLRSELGFLIINLNQEIKNSEQKQKVSSPSVTPNFKYLNSY